MQNYFYLTRLPKEWRGRETFYQNTGVWENLIGFFSVINIADFILQNVHIRVAQIFLQVEKIPKTDGEIAAYKMSELIGRPVVTF